MHHMIACDIAGVRFNYRVAGVCIDEGHVLLYTAPSVDFWFLPGGRVEVGERSEQALVREVEEELGVRVSIGELLWVAENFFGLAPLYHELGFYYQVALPPGSPYQDKTRVYRSPTEVGDEATLRWFPLATLRQVNLLPAFLKDSLRHLPPGTKHLVIHD